LLKPHNTVVLMPMVALFELALRGDRGMSVRMAVSVIPCVVIGVVPFASASSVLSIVVRNVALCLLAIAAGDIIRSRRFAAQRAAAERESAAQRRLDEERLRIARDVHDVVAHAMTAINVQAGVAAHLLERDPGQAYAALRNIKQVSGEALGDLRATLGALRDGPAAADPGVRDIGALADAAGTAGIDVSVDADELAGLSRAVRTASYRIVQEALTNVVRHARAEHAWVTVRRLPDALTIEVRDDGTGNGAPSAPGNGLLGMRERALALGGSLEAAPADGRGWLVAARLPVAADGSPA
jgi:signal transduction histidine kinase